MIRTSWLAFFGFMIFAGCSSSKPQATGDATAISPDSSGVAPLAVAATPAQCEQWTAALRGFSEKMILASQFLTTDEAYARQSDASFSEAFKFDVNLIRRQIEVIATIPDPSDASSMGMPSEVIPQLRKMADLLEANLQSGKPFSDGSGHGEQLIQMLSEINLGGRIALSMALEKAGCKM